MAFEAKVNYSRFIIYQEERATQGDMVDMLSELAAVPHQEKVERRKYMLEISKYFNYDTSTPENAFALSIGQLASRANILLEYREHYGKKEYHEVLKRSSIF